MRCWRGSASACAAEDQAKDSTCDTVRLSVLFNPIQAAVVYSSGNFDPLPQHDGQHSSGLESQQIANSFSLNAGSSSVGAVRWWGRSFFFQPVDSFRISFYPTLPLNIGFGSQGPYYVPLASFKVSNWTSQLAGFDIDGRPGYMYEAAIPELNLLPDVPYFVSVMGGTNNDFLWAQLDTPSLTNHSYWRFGDSDRFFLRFSNVMAFELLDKLDVPQDVPEPASAMLIIVGMLSMAGFSRVRKIQH